jgi:hypothetical protein
MNQLSRNSLALAVSLAFSAGALANEMTKVDYKASQEKITGEYKAAKTSCASLSGNGKDVCVLEAKGKEKIARAELEATYKPTEKNHHAVVVVTAKANYDIAKERCDDLSGNAKDVCVKEAKAAEALVLADAKAKMKIGEANAKADQKASAANRVAGKTSTEARKDAIEDKRDAVFAVEKEKCDAFAGAAKDNCLEKAKITAKQ